MISSVTQCAIKNLRKFSTMVKPTVVFVLGGPGAGKGTQCARIVEKFGYVHLSAGDLLRKEKSNPDSKVGQLISEYIREGKIVPVEITCGLLEKAMNDFMQESKGEKNKFLIDGFPRNQNNLKGWNDKMMDKVVLNFVLNLQCSEEACVERIRGRGKTSGRTDDNDESLEKRFQTFTNETKPIIDHYASSGKIKNVNAEQDADKVFEALSQFFA